MSNKLVSVIIPTYKRSENLIQAIESVLEQTYTNIEIIVVDDNGRDTEMQIETQNNLCKYIETKKIKYIVHDVNRNGSAARNTGFRASKGAYINFLDDDDEMTRYKIEKQVARLEDTDDKVGACYCNSLFIYKGKHGEKVEEFVSLNDIEGQICLEYLIEKSFNTSAIMFKREAVDAINGFDESYRRHQDYELMIRFFSIYEIVCCKGEPLCRYDGTKVRLYKWHGEQDYYLKTKFLSEMKPYLEKMGIYDVVANFFWYEDVRVALRSREYKYLLPAIRNCYAYGTLNSGQVKFIIKNFLKGIIKIILGPLIKLVKKHRNIS